MNTLIDPIDLEVLRTRLEAIGEQAAAAVEHTAISPVVTEAKDYSFTLLDADGGLIIGSGQIEFHFGAASYAVKSTIERHGPTIAPGDVFIGNDPHYGGGLHPQDVMVQQPIYRDGERVAWVVISAHLMDVGGMVVGSFAPAATECFQEALRLPPVRLFRQGEEVTDVWDIFRNNVRLAQLVEMDLRGLVAGCHVAQERVEAVVASVGEERFVASLQALRDLSEAEMRARIAQLEDGVYRTTSWTEFDTEFFKIPCTLTIDGDRMVFDFAGASPQTPHFFNSKPYIIESEFIAMLSGRMAQDLPYNEGIFSAVELRCPEGTIVNARPPAPIAAAHMHVALNAANVALDAVKLALAASPDAPARRFLTGTGFESALGNQVWAWPLPDGSSDAFMVLDGNWVGGSGGTERDGLDLGRNLVGAGMEGMFTDIEILESWYPLLFSEKRARRGVEGAGTHRAGGGNQMTFAPHGIDQMIGTTFGMRRWLPLEGAAGGEPGACNEFLVHHQDGSVEAVDVNVSGIVVTAGERFEMRLANGGGYGDPLERDPSSVLADLTAGRFTEEEAAAVYGVVTSAGTVDADATAARRDEIRQQRLAAATPPVKPVAVAAAVGEGEAVPLYVGVVQRGSVAFAEASGTPLAVAPDHWTDGCAVLEARPRDDGPAVVFRSYLDPATGRCLHVEAVLADEPRAFESSPTRWTSAR
ncbi:MAG TPA: hydantoinase B/oxoprolinase family protein [Acidimicrobiales bacterium]|nr:hydantoinase B/oxoprolinase family protein [Acidimicrobiales bacterium]